MSTSEEFELTSEQESLLMAQAEPLFNQMAQSPQEEENMWIPNLKTGHALVVAALGLTTSLSAAPATDKFAIGFCKTARQTFPAEISPIYDGQAYLEKYQREMLKDNVFEGAKVSLLVRPKHGAIEYQDNRLAVENSWYHYRPQAGFEGTDRFVMQVEKTGVKVKIYYVIKVLDDVEATVGYCPKEFWKISQSDFNSGNQDYAAWLQFSQLSSLIADASQSVAGFQDLAGSAVGTTAGEGSNAAITLDFTAAGHGWYIDSTPIDNTDDYLPTSNPNEWQAKAGSEAAGKMDMLSVLLHEYGHALGLEHSLDARDFMATTLTPGVRRLPSADELTLMSQLVAQLKMESGDAQVTSHAPAQPDAPSSPLPGLPFTGLGLFALGRLRSDRYGLQTLFADGTAMASAPQYEVATNATLTNGSLNAAKGWASEGSVAIASGTRCPERVRHPPDSPEPGLHAQPARPDPIRKMVFPEQE